MVSFCEHLFRFENEINIQWKTDKNWGNEIYFIEKNIHPDVIIHCFIHIFIAKRLNKKIKSVIKECYYFTNEDEISRIAELTNWIVSDMGRNQRLTIDQSCMEDVLYDLFKSNIENKKTIHFDSVIKFRMKSFKNYLINIVGLAIDEFKREEEHQTFIHSIREYINKRKPRHEEIHIVQAEPFLFYKKNGTRYNRQDLKSIMRKEPLYMIGLDENEMNLAPLIALLPSTIKIYGDDSSEARTLSIINIFQERVTFFSYDKFPFKRQEDKS